MVQKKLFIDQNPLDNRWKVIDTDGFVFGDGETIDEAVTSSRIVTDEPIYTNIDCDEIYDNISLADKQADEMDNMIRDTLPDDDYFEINEPT